MRLDLNELNKIIDDSLCRKNRDPLDFYKELIFQLSRRNTNAINLLLKRSK